MTQEPVVTLVVALIAAAAALLAAFGVDITPEQIAALSAFAAAAIGLAFYVRSKVTPTWKLPADRETLKARVTGERGTTLVEALLVIFIVLVILVVLFRLL